MKINKVTEEKDMADLVQVKTNSRIGCIEDNLDAVEASIRRKTEEYAGTVITEEGVAEGKRLLADIRKEAEALNDERKQIKKAWMAPYEAFEARVKKIAALYNEPVELIDGQIKEYEKKRADEKKKEIEGIYEKAMGEFGEWLPLERIYDKRWENVSFSKKKIREEIEARFLRLSESIAAVKAVESEFEEEGLAVLKKTGNLNSALEDMQARKRMKEEILEKEKRAEVQKQSRQEEKEEAAADKKEDASARNTGMEEGRSSAGRRASAVPAGPFQPENETAVTAYVSESRLKEFTDYLKENYIRFEVGQ